MPAIQPIPQIPDQLVACPNCSTAMVLTQINPDRPGYETHTFYCVRCDYKETKVFEIRY
jgi:C4-type Zn-finger protein